MAKSTVAASAAPEPSPKIVTRYDYASMAHPAVSFDQSDPNSQSMTNQSDKESTDINIQFAKYEKTGLVTDLLTGQTRRPMYGDFSDVGDFHALQSTMARVTQSFMALPASIRTRFQNDPAQLVDFLADPKNDPEAIKLGLKPDASPDPDPNIKLHLDPDPKKTQEPAPPAPGQPANPAA